MSGSPRKLLRRAADALQQIDDIVARYPDARADLEAALGAGGLDALRGARTVIDAALDRVEARRTRAAADGADAA